MSETSLIEFHGVEIEACEHSGQPYANLKRMCECLGLGYASQRQKLQEKRWATMTIIVTVGHDGKDRAMAFLSADSVPMWLAGLSEKKVAKHVRPLLEVFQDECRRVLYEHFSENGRDVSINGSELAAIQTTLEEHQRHIVQLFGQIVELQHVQQQNQSQILENQKQILALTKELIPAVRRIDDRTKGHREKIREEDKQRIVRCVARKYQGVCPCCREYPVVQRARKIPDIAEFDHWHHRSMAALDQVWLVCKSCNRKLRDRKPDGFWMRKVPAFQAFQELLFEQSQEQRVFAFDGVA